MRVPDPVPRRPAPKGPPAVPFASPPATRLELDVPREGLGSKIAAWPLPALLESSGPGFGDAGRWGILAAHPRLVFEATGDAWTVREASGRVVRSGTGLVLEALADLVRRFGLADPAEPSDPEAPPFQGGLIGYFGYDLAPRLERLPRKAPRDSRIPDVRFALYDTAVNVDHATGSVWLVAADLLGEGPRAVESRALSWRSALDRPTIERPPEPSQLGPAQSNFTKAAYLDAVRRSLDYIAAGDIFQVNISQRFTAFGKPDPFDLYWRLKARSPAPFAAYLAWDDLAVVSASPEWFYQTRGDRIVTRPIKGTRPRGDEPDSDARLAAELAASPKDRAELTMIVDLERNDIGRIARYGSVRVTEPVTVETFAQVHHLVATIEGRIRPGVGPIDVVRAMFPGGSITGAPKIRAMEIIDELEPTRRGLYTGSVGYFGRGGASGFNIVIRTLIVEGDRAHYQVGGGIVADSGPETEYHETLHKGRALREVIEGAGG
jgi:para-aminobenzoate synthetase component I